MANKCKYCADCTGSTIWGTESCNKVVGGLGKNKLCASEVFVEGNFELSVQRSSRNHAAKSVGRAFPNTLYTRESWLNLCRVGGWIDRFPTRVSALRPDWFSVPHRCGANKKWPLLAINIHFCSAKTYNAWSCTQKHNMVYMNWFNYTVGCETWSLTLREERRLRMFENRVLRRIFRPTRDGVTVEWEKIHNEELNDLYCSPNIVRVIKSRRMRWVGHVARTGERRGVYRVLVGKPEGMRQLGRTRRRWEKILRWLFRK